ncbi:hypothetical protein ACFVH6_09725 [Spirillospora sp. NPDC127200]
MARSHRTAVRLVTAAGLSAAMMALGAAPARADAHYICAIVTESSDGISGAACTGEGSGPGRITFTGGLSLDGDNQPHTYRCQNVWAERRSGDLMVSGTGCHL